MTPDEGAAKLGRPWFQHQLDAFDAWMKLWNGAYPYAINRMLVHYPTGKGKTSTMMMMMALRSKPDVLVVAPPITHEEWVRVGRQLSIDVIAVSHAKFRMKDFKVLRSQAVIVDEFHLLGGHTGQGWKKLDRMAAGMTGPLIMGSATPNYNDAERCYCIAHVLDPWGNRGGYIDWLYQHCTTEPNPFGKEPIVTGFRQYADAASFLEALPGVVYLPDEAPDILVDVPISSPLPDHFEELNLDLSRNRLMASIMEKRHRERYLQIVDPRDNKLRDHVYEELSTLVGNAATPTLIFAAHSTIATALWHSLLEARVPTGYIDGDTPTGLKQSTVQQFIAGKHDVLVGTASMATGTDGIDKMCDHMVILDDTDDPSLRRQLVGRILPRGADVDYSKKVAHRFVYSS